MPTVPKGTKVTAIPWKIPDINWELPDERDWYNPAAWLDLINWRPSGDDVWWAYLQKTTKEDFTFEDSEAREWRSNNTTRKNSYLFVFLGADRTTEYAGFIVKVESLTETEGLWRSRWNSTVRQENIYRALIHSQKKITAIKQYREDHYLCLLKTAKDAIDDLANLMRLQACLAP